MRDPDAPGAQSSTIGEKVFTKADGVVEAEVDGERILLSPTDFSYFGLTGTAPRVWELIDGERTVDDILEILQSDYEATDSEIKDDVFSFLEALQVSGLVSD